MPTRCGWRQLGANSGATRFIYDVYFYIKNPRASEALEFDTNQTTGGRRYVYGTQCGINYDHQWDVWDTAAKTWRKTGIGCSVKAYAWNHLTWEYKRIVASLGPAFHGSSSSTRLTGWSAMLDNTERK
jgi:hypothetical protein